MNATNANTMKEKNRRLIIDLIRQSEASRAELAKVTSLSKAAVSIIVDELIRSGVVSESRPVETGVGRRPLRLTVNPDFLYAVGINITRSYAEVGIADIGGRVLCREVLAVHPKKEALLSIAETVERQIKETGISRDRIYGIGVTAPGPVDTVNTTILNPTNFEEWHYENIGLRLQNLLHTEISLENISGGLALCERYFGMAKELSDYLLLIVSDGIGSGIISSGRLIRSASEIGHTSIRYDGIPCECGNKGCIEKYASVPSILSGSKYQSWQEVIDAEDTRIIEREAEYLACGIINAVNLFGFDHIILEGEINYKPEKLICAIEERLRRNTVTKEVPSVLSGSAFGGVLCAASVVFDRFFSGEL